MGLLPTPPARVTGEVWLGGRDVLGLPEKRAAARPAAARSGMVFQDPMTSLNPFLTIGKQVGEGLEHHLGAQGRRAARPHRRAAADGGDPGARASGSTTTPTSSPAACGSA